jgi:tRNA threonylcarbamoyladenosine modification (KEOPS) complex Cgi121 subunit
MECICLENMRVAAGLSQTLYFGFIKAVMSFNAQQLIASEMGLGSMVKVKQSLFRPVHSQRVAGE